MLLKSTSSSVPLNFPLGEIATSNFRPLFLDIEFENFLAILVLISTFLTSESGGVLGKGRFDGLGHLVHGGGLFLFFGGKGAEPRNLQ